MPAEKRSGRRTLGAEKKHKRIFVPKKISMDENVTDGERQR